MTDWLKEILGDAYTEDIDTKVSAKLAADYAPKSELDTARSAQKAAEEAKQAAEKAAADAAAKSKAELDEARYDAMVDLGIATRRGRSGKAIKALLDHEKLRGAPDRQKAVDSALDALKKDSGYLFEAPAGAPPMADGAGSSTMLTKTNNDAALRAAFGLPAAAGKQ